MSVSLLLHGLQHNRLPCPSPSPGISSNSHPLIWWCYPTISFSVALFSSCPQSFSVSAFFPVSQLFPSGGPSGSIVMGNRSINVKNALQLISEMKEEVEGRLPQWHLSWDLFRQIVDEPCPSSYAHDWNQQTTLRERPRRRGSSLASQYQPDHTRVPIHLPTAQESGSSLQWGSSPKAVSALWLGMWWVTLIMWCCWDHFLSFGVWVT